MSSPEASDKPPAKRVKGKLLSWNKVKCFALGLAVEHQRVFDKNNNKWVPNWNAIKEIMNAVLQDDENFRDAHPNGLSDPNKLRSEFSDRSRGRTPKWRLAKEDCTPEEILAMENIARVVIATERSLAEKDGSSVKSLDPDPIDWVVYPQRDPKERGKTPALKKKKSQPLQPSGSRASRSSEPVGSSDDLEFDDEDDDTIALAPAPNYTARALNPTDHLAKQYDQQTAAKSAASRRAAQEESESEDDDEDFAEMIQLGPRLFERAPKKKLEGPPKKKVRFSNLDAEESGQAMGQRTAGLALPGGIADVLRRQSFSRPAQSASQSFSRSTYPGPSHRPGGQGTRTPLPANAFDYLLGYRPSFPPSNQDMGMSLPARTFGQSIDRRAAFPPRSQEIGLSLSAQPAGRSSNQYSAGYLNSQNTAVSQPTQLVHQSTYPSPTIRSGTYGGSLTSSAQTFSQSINPSPAIRPSIQGVGAPLSMQPFNQSINPGSPFFPVNYDESLLSAEAFRESMNPLPEFLPSFQDVQDSLNSFSGPPPSESIDTGPNSILGDNVEGLSLSVSPVSPPNDSGPAPLSSTQNDNAASAASPFDQSLTLDPALSSGQVDTDYNSALRVNAELNRRHQPTHPPTYPSDFLAKRPMPRQQPRGGIPNRTARYSATPPPYPAQRPYYGDGILESQPQPAQPTQYTWEACKRILMIGLQARRWPDIAEMIRGVPGIDLSNWNFVDHLVTPLATTIGVSHQTVLAAAEEALRRDAITSFHLQRLLVMPTVTPHSRTEPSNWLDSILQNIWNDPKLPMVHAKDVDFSSGEPTYVVRNYKLEIAPSGEVQFDMDDIQQRIEFINQDTMLYRWAGEVRRVSFLDKITGQSHQADVMLCDSSMCIECSPGAQNTAERQFATSLRQGLPVVHQKDIIMLEDTSLAFAPREQSPLIGDVPLAAFEIHNVVFGGPKRRRVICCNKLACTACLRVPCPASLTWMPGQ